MLGKATEAEFRYRVAILLASQLLWALLFLCALSPSTLVRLVAAVLASTGVALRLWASGTLADRVMAASRLQTDLLVQEGPYRFGRNPLYLGSILFLTGYALAFHPVWGLVFAVITVWRYQRIVRLEETQLDQSHGQDYQTYCSQTARWWSLKTSRSASAADGVRFGSIPAQGLFVGGCIGLWAAVITGEFAAIVWAEAMGGGISLTYLWWNRRANPSAGV